MSAVDAFWAAPPVARTLTAAAVALSLPTHMGLISAGYIIWITGKVLTLRAFPEAWRLVTSFLLTGPKFGLILDPYFLYTYGSQLERGSPQFSAPGDFLVYVLFTSVVILSFGHLAVTVPGTEEDWLLHCAAFIIRNQSKKSVCGVQACWYAVFEKPLVDLYGIELTDGVYLRGMVFLSPLSLALAYTWSQENPNQQVSYFIVTFSSKYLPYAMLALTFVMDSPIGALHQATGLLAAHLYLFLTKIWPEYGGGRNIIYTPAFIRDMFAGPGGAPSQRNYGTAFSARTTQNQSATQNQTGRGGGWASGFSSGSNWNERGQGRRLGGD